MEMLRSQDQMSKANIKIAGVRLRQAIGKSKEQVYKRLQAQKAIGKSKEQVYKRLQAQEVRTTDAFHVVLDVHVTKLESTTKKEQARLDSGDKWRMIIPVKRTWNKLESVCRKEQVTVIRNGLAQAAKRTQHIC